ncbi:hypothetical protein Pmar_PMAR010870 [Perkinsus marinus ATCC 50983]|uniref:Uncharacterized protein n=1 Tax=Perkinsus marinus (strain ATCC 50983 / TXsc) TaxID=423536 RepID=C5LU75_PERM5|nr:hypothetical protein Pmar_PMAR010870 [Perkinsus marinus ATCC 50983]EEQ99608.1 hypothetical protein Pmar_PMAR010870 [Perkinsus marinus ATCC 50983]|eukprot:XP_002766891.1 hypothetical protein Pmar_PMAR010870 [Perkinsus marinus ATCC 50983]
MRAAFVGISSLIFVISGIACVYRGKRMNDDGIFSALEVGYGKAMIGLGCGCLLAGVVGVMSAYSRKRYLLSGYVLLSVLLGGSLLALSCVLADVSRTDADKFATVCGRHRDTGALYGSERMLILMSEYESMSQALSNCMANHRNTSTGGSLEECPGAVDDQLIPWEVHQYSGLLREAERRYHCGGACEPGTPLFGWSEGAGKGGGGLRDGVGDKPLEPCVKGIMEDLQGQANANATLSLATAIPLLLSGFCGALLCCSRAQKRLEGRRQQQQHGLYQLAPSTEQLGLLSIMLGEDSTEDSDDEN